MGMVSPDGLACPEDSIIVGLLLQAMKDQATADSPRNEAQIVLYNAIKLTAADNLFKFLANVVREVNVYKQAFQLATNCGWNPPNGTSHKQLKRGHDHHDAQAKRSKPEPTILATPQRCKGCGRQHVGECRLKTHPDYNATNEPWASSAMGRQYSAIAQTQLLNGKKLNAARNTLIPIHGEQTICMLCSPCHTDTINATVLSTHDVLNLSNILLDTGALQANYLTAKVAEWLHQRGHAIHPDESVVCSAFDECSMCKGNVKFLLKLNIESVALNLQITAKNIGHWTIRSNHRSSNNKTISSGKA
jgi:hypothetical protein